MTLTTTQALLTILVIGAVTLFTRLLPFALFPGSRPTPKYILYLGKVLPFATIGMLVIYCLREVSFAASSHGLPEGIAVAAIVALQLWKRNSLLSVGGGTVVYMVLVQLVF